MVIDAGSAVKTTLAGRLKSWGIGHVPAIGTGYESVLRAFSHVESPHHLPHIVDAISVAFAAT
jgi:hypothetical protein